MIKLPEAQVKRLLERPESGMGYQTVEVEIEREVGIRKGTVYNAELLVWEEEPKRFLEAGYEYLIKSASSEEAKRIKAIRVVQPSRHVTKALAEQQPGKPATEGEQQETSKNEVFMRFTAYQNDRRITSKKGLLPGTYATTEKDSKNVKTGSEAVERYALPDPKPAIYRFRIDPLTGTVYRQGIVQPAFGRKGGGVEVIFDNGTDPNTVSGPAVLPP